jgi:hypothetical protein
MLNHNLKRIIYYTPYSEPVWPKRRNTVRTWCLNSYTNKKRFAPWALNAKTVQPWLLPVRFTSRLFVSTPHMAYSTTSLSQKKREVTPLQRVTTKTATTTYENSSWFQTFMPPKSTPSRHAMLWSNSPNTWNYLPAHESFVRSLFPAKKFIFEIWSSWPASSDDYEDGC